MNKNITVFKQVSGVVGIVLIGFILMNNAEVDMLILIPLCLGLLVLRVIKNKCDKEIIGTKTRVLWLAEFLVILGIASVDITDGAIVLALIQVGEIVINSRIKIGLYCSVIAYVAYVLTMYFSHDYTGYHFMVTTINFVIAYLLVTAIRYQMAEKKKAQEVAQELRQTTDQLQRANEKLQELYDEKEELIVLKERNRIAGEIHDTVGHCLTTVIIELEASKRLMKKDSERALEKLGLAQEQVRAGLQDIRESVHALKDGESLIDFGERLETFLCEIEKNSEVEVHSEVSPLPKLGRKLENIIYRAIQEGVTNGIRHGKSSEFDIKLGIAEKTLILEIKDKGEGNQNIQLGFGLTNMKQKIEEVGGTIEVSSKQSGGTSLRIQIPILIEGEQQ